MQAGADFIACIMPADCTTCYIRAVHRLNFTSVHAINAEDQLL